MFQTKWCAILLACLSLSTAARALSPGKRLSQLSRTVWSQADGLPQDTILRIAQDSDGFLWLATDEGLARFDGYEFVLFTKNNSDLPANSITALAASKDGALWIGTSNGLVLHRKGRFQRLPALEKLSDIQYLFEDRAGSLWIVAGGRLSRLQSGRLTSFEPGKDIPMPVVNLVTEDLEHNLWIASFDGIAKLAAGTFVRVVEREVMGFEVPLWMIVDAHENLWVAGNRGILVRTPKGVVTQYQAFAGLREAYARSVLQDGEGNLWIGSNEGLSRLAEGRPSAAETDRSLGSVRCLFEDREGNLWAGTSRGLVRFRDNMFTVYSRGNGLPSDEPNAVFQDRSGRVWVGFHEDGLMQLGDSAHSSYTARDGLSGSEVFTIRQTRGGDLLLGTRYGLSRFREGRFQTFLPATPLSRVYDAMEDSKGRVWLATALGVVELRGTTFRPVIPAEPVNRHWPVVLCEGLDGAIWAGTYGSGLWRYRDGASRLFTTVDGLSSNQIRSLYQDADGTLWIGTFGGGLASLRDGRFRRFTSKDGLLSDNVGHVEDDTTGSLWLSTTRGICAIPKRQLEDFANGKLGELKPTNYGVEDGLLSAQCAPGYPTAGGGTRTSDGRMWFTTSRGLAVLDPNLKSIRNRSIRNLPPLVHVTGIAADGRPVDLSGHAKLKAGTSRVEIRYTGIHLRAPSRVQYSYMLEGLDASFVQAQGPRPVNYSNLNDGRYRFVVRASLPEGLSSETSYPFEVLPHWYETAWFELMGAVLVLGAAGLIYRYRVHQIRSRFSYVLKERTRLAREIHDTLAQGFVGISSQLGAVAVCLADRPEAAKQHLELASKMTRHCLTEARRSVMDLRASSLDGQGLGAALVQGVQFWTAGSGVSVEPKVDDLPCEPAPEVEQHLLRIAQEAVTNVLKHAGASQIRINLQMKAKCLELRVADNGCGTVCTAELFEPRNGHFGLLGMRERAGLLGGEFFFESKPGSGTEVIVRLPLS